MTSEEIARIAAAIATANGHSEPDGWAAKVVEAWQASNPNRRENDTAQAIAESRLEREEEL